LKITSVSSSLPHVRTCAKMRCGSEPVATISLRYAEKEVVVAERVPERDPNLLDLCAEHVGRMTPPVGWTVRDVREPATTLAP